MKPVVYALMDKPTRFRKVLDNQVLEMLSSVDIKKNRLPTQMGGTRLIQSKWTANRRAAELAEI
jgi:hypothetical protein